MQLVLVIDLSASPATALVVDVEGPLPRIVEKSQEDLPPAFLQNLLDTTQPDESDREPRDEARDIAAAAEAVNPIKTLVGNLRSEWTGSVVLLPPLDYISLNLGSPFGEPRQLDKVLSLEVQDNIPFELQDMHFYYQPFKGLGEEKFDVHVGLMPKRTLERIILLCREAGVEGTVICPFSDVLGALKQAREDSFGDSVVIYARYPVFALGIFVEGELRSGKMYHANLENHEIEAESSYVEEVARRFQATVLSFENRSHLSLENVLVAGDELLFSRIRELLKDRNLEHVTLPSASGGGDVREELAALGALFVREKKPAPPLCNFRTGRFAVALRLDEVVRGMKCLAPYVGAAMLCIIASLAFIYYGRKSHLDSINATILETVGRLIPSVGSHPGNPADFVRGEIQTIEKQLGALGSPFKMSPLDAVLEISRDFKKRDRGNATIKRVSVVGKKVTIEGVAPSYSSLDIIERVFNKKRTYCDTKKTVTPANTAGTTTLNFSFTVELCES